MPPTTRPDIWQQPVLVIQPQGLAMRGETIYEGSTTEQCFSSIDPLTLRIPAGAHQNIVRPFSGEKVHRTFS